MSTVPLITIVDDDDSLRDSLGNLIRSAGFRVQGFSSAEVFLSSNRAHDTKLLKRLWSVSDVQASLFEAGVASDVIETGAPGDRSRSAGKGVPAIHGGRWDACGNGAI